MFYYFIGKTLLSLLNGYFSAGPEHCDFNVFKATIPTQDNSGPLLVLLQTLRLQTPGPQGVRSGGGGVDGQWWN